MTTRPYEVGGIGVVNATPLTADGAFNEAEYRRHLRFLADAGVRFIQPSAATGQGMQTSEEDFFRILEVSCEEIGDRVFVTAYTGRDSTEETIRLTREAQRIGVHAAYIIQPFFSTPDPQGLELHYRAVAEAITGLPLVFYNNPTRAGIRLPIDVMARLVEEYDAFVGLKQSELDELSDSFARLSHKIQVMARADKEILAGLAHGAPGALTFAGNIVPAELVRILEAFNSGDVAGARKEYFRVLPVMNAVHIEPVPGAVKYMLNRIGWDFGEPKLPSHPLRPENAERVDEALRAVGLLDR
jgi:4-hydroxy-tetrahydrodipicolinate synthase